jgi:hypothetical protein
MLKIAIKAMLTIILVYLAENHFKIKICVSKLDSHEKKDLVLPPGKEEPSQFSSLSL